MILLATRSVYADCVSISNATKCARIPSSSYDIIVRAAVGDYTDGSWRTVRHYFINDEFVQGHYFSGTSATLTAEGSNMTVTCHVSSPLVLTLSLYGDLFGSSNPYEICARYMMLATMRDISDISKLPGDECPDGFYTVPYDISCGAGFVDVADIPSCDDDTSGDFCVIMDVIPCASGISVLRTGTGLSFSLWAEKYTTPAICVLHNETTCYVNLEQGESTNSINVNYNGIIYHAIN